MIRYIALISILSTQAIACPISAGIEPEGQTQIKTISICHEFYHSMFRLDTKTPLWVVEVTNKDLIGENGIRKTQFHSEFGTPTKNDYKNIRDKNNNLLAAGHNAPAANFYNNKKAQYDSFSYANMFPQVQECNNSGIWSSIEKWIRQTTIKHGPTKVITASQFNKDIARTTTGIGIPNTLYKVVYNEKLNRIIAFKVTNEKHCNIKINDTVVSVQTVEQETNLKFFKNVNAMQSTSIW